MIKLLALSAAAICTVFLCGCGVKTGEEIAAQYGINGEGFIHLKEGYYCGEGDCTKEHNVGYIYFTNAFSEEEAMEKAGFHDEGETVGKGEEKQKAFTSDRHATTVILSIEDYDDGHLLTYRVVGAC